jgi:hypothetical protein
MKYVKNLPESIRKFVRQNSLYIIILHLINLLVGFGLYFLFFNDDLAKHYGGFLIAYLLLWPVLKKLYSSCSFRIIQCLYCVIFIISIGYLAMFLTMTFAINTLDFHSHFISQILANLLTSIAVVSLGIYVILWPVVLILGFINYILIKIQQKKQCRSAYAK